MSSRAFDSNNRTSVTQVLAERGIEKTYIKVFHNTDGTSLAFLSVKESTTDSPIDGSSL